MWQLALMVVLFICSEAQDENLVIYSQQLIQNSAGASLILHCSAGSQQQYKHKLEWQKCSAMDENCPIFSVWSAVCKGCTSMLLLVNTMHHHSGTYRCVYNHSSVLAVFQLDVTEPSIPPEESEVSSSNVTILEGTPAVFHCWVRSQQHVDIRWLLQEETITNTSESIEYQGIYYKPLSTTGQAQQRDMYHSKLILERTTVQDSGCYVCVALGQSTSTAQGTRLTVHATSLPSSPPKSDDSLWSLHLLFLIPAGLALPPAAAWLCCQRRRRVRNEHPPHSYSALKYHQPVGKRTSTSPSWNHGEDGEPT